MKINKIVRFNENGDEYTGQLIIECNTFKQITKNTIEVNDAIISIDEDIIEIVDF